MDGGSLRRYTEPPRRIEYLCGTPNRAAACSMYLCPFSALQMFNCLVLVVKAPEIALRQNFTQLTNVWELGVVMILSKHSTLYYGLRHQSNGYLNYSVFQSNHTKLEHCMHWNGAPKAEVALWTALRQICR